MEIVLVNSESPAWHAGLKLGDILVMINDQKINNIGDYRNCLETLVVNGGKKTLEFKVIRKGKVKVFTVEFR